MSSPHIPSEVRLIASSDVWMEAGAVDQLRAVAAQASCVRAVGMPDLHPGGTSPIGAAFLFRACVRPDLVGGDVGCGVLVLAGRKDGPRGDALERRVRAALDEPLLPSVNRSALLERAWHVGPSGLTGLSGIPDDLAEIGARLADSDDGASGMLPDRPGLGEQLGTIGGGNHFAEIARIDRIADRVKAGELGLHRDAQVVLVHSGSRSLGGEIAARHGRSRTDPSAIETYFRDQQGAVRWARTNRLLVAWRIARAAGLGSAVRIAAAIDIVHNAISVDADGGYLHRKGVAPADDGQTTVVLGSRGAPSYVLRGLGNPECLSCVAHGAGRRMGRAEARDKLRAKVSRASLERSELGARVICDDTALMYEEHPAAYKPIEPIIASLEAARAATRIASLVPLVTVKR